MAGENEAKIKVDIELSKESMGKYEREARALFAKSQKDLQATIVRQDSSKRGLGLLHGPMTAVKALKAREVTEAGQDVKRAVEVAARAKQEIERGMSKDKDGLFVGSLKRLWYGERGDPNEAKRKARSEGGQFGSNLLRAAVDPLPGGRVLSHTFERFGEGYRGAGEGAEGEEAGGVRGGLKKLGGGLLMGGAALSVAAIGAAVAAAVAGSRETEKINYQLGQIGGPGSGERAVAIGRKNDLLPEESAAVGSQYLRATGRFGSGEGFNKVAALQQGYGMGGAASSFLGTMNRASANLSPAGEKKALTDIISTAMATGLKQGRFGELLEGAANLAQGQTLGVKMGEGGLDNMSKLLYGLKGSALTGSSGIQGLNQLDRVMKGGGGALSQSLVMQNMGLGSGQGYFETKYQMENGLFGGNKDDTGKSMSAAKGVFDRGKELFTDDKTRFSVMGAQMGMSAHTYEALEKALETGSVKGFEEALAKGKDDQTRARDAMIQIGKDWKALDRAIHDIEETLGKALSDSGVIGLIAKGIHHIDELATEWFGTKKKEETEKINDPTTKDLERPSGVGGMVWDANHPDAEKQNKFRKTSQVEAFIETVKGGAADADEAHDLDVIEKKVFANRHMGDMSYDDRAKLYKNDRKSWDTLVNDASADTNQAREKKITDAIKENFDKIMAANTEAKMHALAVHIFMHEGRVVGATGKGVTSGLPSTVRGVKGRTKTP